MSIAGSKRPPLDIAPKPTPEVEKYQTVNTLETNRPLASIASYIEGYSWNVTYYAQVLGADDSVNPFSLDTSPVIQQYKRLDNLELKVQSELSYDFNKGALSDQFRGEAIVYPGTIIPSRYDLFLADVGLNELAMFTVTDVTPKTALAETVYEITYASGALLKPQHSANLELKTVDTGLFSKEFLLSGQNPVLTEGKVKNITELHDMHSLILDSFCNDFVHKRSNFLLAPENNRLIYDPYLFEFLSKTMDLSQDHRLRSLNRPGFRGIVDLDVISVWDIIFEGTRRKVHKVFNVYDTRYFRTQHTSSNIYYTILNGFIAPTTINSGRLGRSVRVVSVDELYPIVDGSRPLIHNVDTDDNYVLSEAFYSNDLDNMSTLEILVNDYIEKKDLNLTQLFNILEAYESWHDLERFYYAPIILVLIQYVLRCI